MPNPIRVLFLCTGNSARSQMAEALLRGLGAGRFAAFSAGTDPKGVHPLTIAALTEAGIPPTGQTSKHLSQYLDDRFDYVITVCDRAAENCPVFPGGGTRLHWSFEDPADPTVPEAERLARFRRIRDEIRERISSFLAEARADS